MGRLLHRFTRPGAVLALLLAVFAGTVSAQDRAPGIPATDPAFMPLLRLADELESKAQNCAAGDCPNVDCAKFADLRTSLAAIKALLGPTEWLSLYGETADKPDGSPRRLEGDVRTLGYWMALLREDTMRHVADVNAGLNRNARRRDNLDRLRMVATFFTDMSKLAQDAIDIASLGKLLVERAPQLMFRFDEPASALKDIADMLGVLDGAIAMVDGVDVFKRQQQVVEGEAAAAGLDLPGSVGTLTNAMGMISDGVGSAVSVRELRKARALAAEAGWLATDACRPPLVPAGRDGARRRGATRTPHRTGVAGLSNTVVGPYPGSGRSRRLRAENRRARRVREMARHGTGHTARYGSTCDRRTRASGTRGCRGPSR